MSAGHLGKPWRSTHGEPQLGEVAQLARAYADALIAELMREQVAGGHNTVNAPLP